ncbi:PREDICTED: subtilisin-like protease SBT3.6 [Tarenaya hassleriana]|uniref:subtilisin-like protease SBT3.6 n=1 Tax=Tarenaya hassleriana TaxID=28532 RepID=UPI0008FD0FF5|nr:PREDICTED: subtilisin-like protease SBT3.6 [Tarenaya hassleriana]
MGKTPFLVATCLMLSLCLQSSFVYAGKKVYIVYLGGRHHDDHELLTEYHRQMLWSILGSEEAAYDSMIYSYRHSFSGFAAKLTASQARMISELPEVIHVTPDRAYQLATTRTWDYLGLSATNPRNLLNKTNMGEQVIVGVVDSGVWPESEMFSDKGYGPIPSRWKGGCQSGQQFNASTHCNRKLIGAKYFIDGLLAAIGDLNTTVNPEFISPRDFGGHGTHVASTVAGSFVSDVSYGGLGRGTVRGGAPRARIAMYKACWLQQGTCFGADLLKAIDEAVRDGVDLISISVGGAVPLSAEFDLRDSMAVGSFHAVTRGIPVVCAGGNAGPAAQTIVNTAPWILTVAATTLDRSFPTPITLGNNVTILGQSMYVGREIGFTGLVYPENSGDSDESFSGTCEQLSVNPTRIMAGKVVLCFTTRTDSGAVRNAAAAVKQAGGLGVIVARNPGVTVPCGGFPCVLVDYELGTDILFYIRSSVSPVAKVKPSGTLFGQPVATKVATFSSRGPNSLSPAILKPDIAAPGVNILAATSQTSSSHDKGFVMMSGTSMATPAVSGIVSLLRALHPDWSPAAIRSALVTTAWKTDPSGQPIVAEGSNRKLADPFDYGGGLVNPEKAADPGLIYDMGIDDYVLYMCSVGYSDPSISQLVGKATSCPNPRPSVLDLNLPSITIPNLKDEVTLTRTVIYVGSGGMAVYRAMVEPPLGIRVDVTPKVLVFGPMTRRASFKVRVKTGNKVNTGYHFGSLTWTDSDHKVTIPLSVRTQILPNYSDVN